MGLKNITLFWTITTIIKTFLSICVLFSLAVQCQPPGLPLVNINDARGNPVINVGAGMSMPQGQPYPYYPNQQMPYGQPGLYYYQNQPPQYGPPRPYYNQNQPPRRYYVYEERWMRKVPTTEKPYRQNERGQTRTLTWVEGQNGNGNNTKDNPKSPEVPVTQGQTRNNYVNSVGTDKPKSIIVPQVQTGSGNNTNQIVTNSTEKPKTEMVLSTEGPTLKRVKRHHHHNHHGHYGHHHRETETEETVEESTYKRRYNSGSRHGYYRHPHHHHSHRKRPIRRFKHPKIPKIPPLPPIPSFESAASSVETSESKSDSKEVEEEQEKPKKKKRKKSKKHRIKFKRPSIKFPEFPKFPKSSGSFFSSSNSNSESSESHTKKSSKKGNRFEISKIPEMPSSDPKTSSSSGSGSSEESEDVKKTRPKPKPTLAPSVNSSGSGVGQLVQTVPGVSGVNGVLGLTKSTGINLPTIGSPNNASQVKQPKDRFARSVKRMARSVNKNPPAKQKTKATTEFPDFSDFLKIKTTKSPAKPKAGAKPEVVPKKVILTGRLIPSTVKVNGTPVALKINGSTPPVPITVLNATLVKVNGTTLPGSKQNAVENSNSTVNDTEANPTPPESKQMGKSSKGKGKKGGTKKPKVAKSTIGKENQTIPEGREGGSKTGKVVHFEAEVKLSELVARENSVDGKLNKIFRQLITVSDHLKTIGAVLKKILHTKPVV